MPHQCRPLGLRCISSSIAMSLLTLSTLGLFGVVVTSPALVLPAQFPLFTDSDSDAEKAHNPITVMVVGDSISQGFEGDWTWRYRLWQWLEDQAVEVDFVGPWNGTQRPENASPSQSHLHCSIDLDSPTQITSGGYAVGIDPNFDSDHFSAWGRQLLQDCDLIRDVVATYNPDYLLVLLGFNDLGWFVSDAEGTFESMMTFVKEARAAKPDIKMALGNVPQRRFMDGRSDLPVKTDTYNRLLQVAIPQLSTPTSQIELVLMQENYDCDIDGCPAGYDGLHPNALGEYQIAQAFSRTLVNDFSIGNSEIVIPQRIPDRPLSLPDNFRAISDEATITVTWNTVYGATGYDLQFKRANTNTWHKLFLATNHYEMSWFPAGKEYEFKIRSRYGDTAIDWSDSITVYRPHAVPVEGVDFVVGGARCFAGSTVPIWNDLEDFVPPYTIGTGRICYDNACSFRCLSTCISKI